MLPLILVDGVVEGLKDLYADPFAVRERPLLLRLREVIAIKIIDEPPLTICGCAVKVFIEYSEKFRFGHTILLP